MLYLTSSFSLGMLEWTIKYILEIQPLSLDEVKKIVQEKPFISAVGHDATARLLTNLLETLVPFNRRPITLKDGDEVIVFQILTRLPEGAVLTLSELKNVKYAFLLVKVKAL